VKLIMSDLLMERGIENANVCKPTFSRTDWLEIVRECNMPFPTKIDQKNHDSARLAFSARKSLSLSAIHAILQFQQSQP
jgi:hypothetical protein